MSETMLLDVLLHGKRVATLANLGGDRVTFGLRPEYIDDEARATLSLSLTTAAGTLATKPKVTQTRLVPFFSNLLPEAHMRTYLAERARVKKEREFYLLEVLGRDLPGAVEVVRSDGSFVPEKSEADRLGLGRRIPMDGPLRFSLAGVQMKFSAVHGAAGGLTIPADGVGGSWIVKLPSPIYPDVVENEFAMLEFARRIGIEVPDTMLVSVSDIENLPAGINTIGSLAMATKRFDREEARRIHIEDFAQIFDVFPERKYHSASFGNIARVLGAAAGVDDVQEFVRRLAFNMLIGNGDMHLKNWSVIYRDDRNPELAPAYDFVSTVGYVQNDDIGLSLAGIRQFDEISWDTWRRFAEKSLMPVHMTLQTVRDTMEKFRAIWTNNDLDMPVAVRRSIEKHLGRIPFWRER